MEVESALVSHPAVAEAAVVGRPDDLKGEGIVAFVTLGEASFVGAVSKNVEQVFDAPFTVFWGLKKK
jgi:acyl-coenzyme A synthetase/AMP-(fatty) acid ligase